MAFTIPSLQLHKLYKSIDVLYSVFNFLDMCRSRIALNISTAKRKLQRLGDTRKTKKVITGNHLRALGQADRAALVLLTIISRYRK